MGLEVSWSVELSTADVTAIRFLSCVDGFVAGEVSFVAEGSLAPVTFVWLVTVDLESVSFKSILLCIFGVAFMAKECSIFTAGV